MEKGGVQKERMDLLSLGFFFFSQIGFLPYINFFNIGIKT